MTGRWECLEGVRVGRSLVLEGCEWRGRLCLCESVSGCVRVGTRWGQTEMGFEQGD